MKWHKVYLRKMTGEEKEFYKGDFEEIWDGNIPELDKEVLVTFPLSSGKFVDTRIDTWIEITDNDVIYWMEIPQYNGELDD